VVLFLTDARVWFDFFASVVVSHLSSEGSGTRLRSRMCFNGRVV
jgi:hypothetical protein